MCVMSHTVLSFCKFVWTSGNSKKIALSFNFGDGVPSCAMNRLMWCGAPCKVGNLHKYLGHLPFSMFLFFAQTCNFPRQQIHITVFGQDMMMSGRLCIQRVCWNSCIWKLKTIFCKTRHARTGRWSDPMSIVFVAVVWCLEYLVYTCNNTYFDIVWCADAHQVLFFCTARTWVPLRFLSKF